MDVPDLTPMGVTGFYLPQDRAVLAGRGFDLSAEWAGVLPAGERFIGLKVDSSHFVVVWSVSAGNVAGGVGNNAGTIRTYIGTIDTPSTVTPVNLMTTGPSAAGIIGESGVALSGGAIPGISTAFNLAGQNILNSIRAFGPGTNIVLGLKNEDAQNGDLSVSVLLAIFDKTAIDDVVL